MRHEPTLIVTRLRIERHGLVAYDEPFHAGVNVIRGDNSSGKSTILNFIFYGLGGDLTDWSEHALLCTRVFVEVSLNGKTASLSREIAREHGQPMFVFGGNLAAALDAPIAGWIRYPYRRSQNLESFSQALFRLLGIPEVASEVSGNLTVHQILRLLYADQLSPVENLFRFDPFDSPTIRDAVGRLLCGTFEPDLYNNELRIRALTRDFDVVDRELRSIFAVLGGQNSLTREWLDAERFRLEQERASLNAQIQAAERELYVTQEKDTVTLRAQEEAYAAVQRLQADIGRARDERDALAFSIADSAAFIASLEAKLVALNDSSIVARHFGDIKFQSCPVCYAPVEANSPPHLCPLCKAPFDSKRAAGRIIALINDTAIQLKQSRLLQTEREKQTQELATKLARLESDWREASRRLSELQKLPSTELRNRLRDLHRQSGYLDRGLEDLNEKAKLINKIDELSTRSAELNETIASLKTENQKLRYSQEQRLARAYTLIADEVRTLLHNDLRRQDSFEDAKSISFDFAENRISVDGHTYFSASSRVILKSSFFLGFVTAATKEPFFRHPRFCILDTIEDKGMEPERSHNCQYQILRVSEESPVEHQIIYATSMIAHDLDDARYTVGKFSTRDDPTLAISSA